MGIMFCYLFQTRSSFRLFLRDWMSGQTELGVAKIKNWLVMVWNSGITIPAFSSIFIRGKI